MGVADGATGAILEKLYYNADGLCKSFDASNAENTRGATTLNIGRSAYIPFGYLGMVHDEYTGRYHTHYRDYDPLHARWLSEDPAGYADGLNLYAAYVGVNGIDPMGLALYAFDGTGNDKDDDEKIKTYIAALHASYDDGEAFYRHGVGTRSKKAFGKLFARGARERLNWMWAKFEETYNNGNGDTVIDIIGFSRGAAMAREFANMIHDQYPDAEIRFLGLLDTVAQEGAPDENNINPGLRLDIPENVQYTAHAVAKHEFRKLFPLTSIVNAYGGKKYDWLSLKGWLDLGADFDPITYGPDEFNEYIGLNYWEKPFDGAHSDIGYNYSDGGNMDALGWMYSVARDKGVQFNYDNLMDYLDDNDYKKTDLIHDSRYPIIDKVPGTNWGRKTRIIFPGNLEKTDKK